MTKELNFKQELTACFGKPVAENPTQAMVEAIREANNLPGYDIVAGARLRIPTA